MVVGVLVDVLVDGSVLAGVLVDGSVAGVLEVVVGAGSAQMPSAVAVGRSTTPVTGNRFARWKLRTAVTVIVPYTVSM